MNSLTLATQTIKDTVSAQDVGQALGLEIRHGRCQCPFHGGKDFNCVLYPGNRGWYCHVCKRGGDVVSFAQEYLNVPFPDTIRWFNSTFGLGMDIDSPLSPDVAKRADFSRKKRILEQELEKCGERIRLSLALTMDRMVRRLEDVRDANQPKTYGEKWNDEFCKAVELLPEAERYAEECMIECVKKEYMQDGEH